MFSCMSTLYCVPVYCYSLIGDERPHAPLNGCNVHRFNINVGTYIPRSSGCMAVRSRIRAGVYAEWKPSGRLPYYGHDGALL